MKTLTCTAFVAALLLTAPAFASGADYMANGQTPNNSGSGEGRVDPLYGAIPEKDNCEQWLERARQMTEPSNRELADRAHHQIMLAHEALADGDEHACKIHVAHALFDRT